MIGIDLGSNTLRACNMQANGEILWDFERIVGSARNLNEQGLCECAKERIFKALVELKDIYKLQGQYFAAATAAFRIAKNSKEFLHTIKQELNIEFEIINAKDEGKYTQIAIKSRLKKLGIYDENTLFIDLGGASTEISFQDEIKSFDFGIVKYCNDELNICDICADAIKFMKKFPSKMIVLNAGVATSIAALKLGLNYDNYNANLINGVNLTLQDFIYAQNQIQNSQNPEILVGKNRSDLMLVGISLLEFMLKDYKIPFVVVDDGLREGLCFCLFNKIIQAKIF